MKNWWCTCGQVPVTTGKRVIKPALFTDEAVGSQPMSVRWLFACSLTLADDEGLLIWNARSMKSNAFGWDDDLTVKQVGELMGKLAKAGMLVSYVAGGTTFGWIIHFVRHQLVPRPVGSHLPPPPLDSPEVAVAYAKRDGWICGLCGGTLDEGDVALLHLASPVSGGSNYPRNVKAVHPACVPQPVAGEPEPPPMGELDLGLPVKLAVVNVRELASKVESNAGTLVGEWLDRCNTRPPAAVVGRVSKCVKKLLEEGMVPVDVSAGLAEWQDKGLDPGALPSVINEVMNGSQLSTADRRVAAGMKLAQHYRDKGE